MAKSLASALEPPAELVKESLEGESSSEEDENSSESDSKSELEPESNKTDNAKSSTPVLPPKIPIVQTADSSSEDDESGSDSESDPKPEPTVKPIVSKPVDDPKKVDDLKKTKSMVNKASLSSPLKPESVAGVKRPSSSETGAEYGEQNSTKRSKKTLEKDFDESEKRTNPFQRLWSEADELALLNGIVDFSANQNMDPVYTIHDFIKPFIHIEVTKSQLQEKIRRLKKKYLTNEEKHEKGDTLTNHHELKLFEMSKKVWGNETSSATPKLNGDVATSDPCKNANVVAEEGEKAVKNSVGSKRGLSVNWSARNLGTEEWIMEESMQLVVGEKRAKMDEKWKKFMMEEAELYAKRLDLLLEGAKLVINALNSSGN